MKKSIIYICVAIILVSLSLALVPIAKSQEEQQNIKILSYTYYIDNAGILDVVGEVQNIGPNPLKLVEIQGTVYADGADQGDSYAQIGIEVFPITYLSTGAKAPFYMSFYEPTEYPQAGWTAFNSPPTVTLSVLSANATANYVYPDLSIVSSSGSIGTDPGNSITGGTTGDKGVYWVSGTIKNTGSQTAQNITIYGTFYNSTGNVVAVGDSFSTVPTLSPSESYSFKFGAFDLNQTQMSSSMKIKSYSLTYTVLNPILEGATPVVTPYESSNSNSPTSSDSSSSSSDSSSQSGTNTTTSKAFDPTFIAIIVVVIIVVAIGAVVALKRQNKANLTTKEKLKQKRSGRA